MDKEDIEFIKNKIENVEKNIKELRDMSHMCKEIINKIIIKIEDKQVQEIHKTIGGWWWSA